MADIAYSQYNATQRTRTTDNPEGPLESDIVGNLKTTIATSLMAQKVTVVGDLTYVALAPAGTTEATAGWQAYRVVVSGATTTITWADGDTLYDNVATNLSALTYA